VVYHADEFSRVKLEQYTQTRLPDGQITLDYSERYEKRQERVTLRNVFDPPREVSATTTPAPQIVATSSDEDETDEQSEDDDPRPGTEKEEVLSEEEKKGLHMLFAVFKCTVWLLD